MDGLCSAIEALNKTAKKNIVMIVLNNGYATKDVAELMGVSISAVSRYTHDELAPSTASLCRLLSLVDEDTRMQIISYIAEELWSILSKLLEIVPGHIVEKIADELAKIMVNRSTASRTNY